MNFRIPNAIQIQAVSSSSDNTVVAPALIQPPSPEDFAEYATTTAYWARRTAQATAALYVGKRVFDIASDVAVIVIAHRLTK